MQNVPEIPTDTESEYANDWQGEPYSTLVCLACGAQFDTPVHQPRIRCPECGEIGYSDRAGRNLVSTGWDCLSCGARNDGLKNFCLECGAGLTSRCLKCEAPVYTSICQRCGSHQEALIRLKSIEAERANWVPIQRSYLEAERRKLAQQDEKQAARQKRQKPEPGPSERIEEAIPASQINSGSWQTAWPRVNQQMQQAAQQRTQRFAQRRADLLRRVVSAIRTRLMAFAWIILGAIFLLWQWRAALPNWIISAAKLPFMQAVLQTAASWWQMTSIITTNTGTVDKSSPQYAIFFAVSLFTIAAIPILGYLTLRLIRWLAS